MSRSRKNPKYQAYYYGSDTVDRRRDNRRFRRINKVRVQQGEEPKQLREVSNKYNWKTDGTTRYRTDWRRWIRNGRVWQLKSK